MNIQEFMSRGDTTKPFSVPEWFVLNPKSNVFDLVFPKKNPDGMVPIKNFEIFNYDGCIPYFKTKTAGVTLEGRDVTIRKMKGVLQKGRGATLYARIIREVNNEHHKNALKVMLMIKSGKDVLMREQHVGYIPAKLANFLRFAEDHGVFYRCIEPIISTSQTWVSIAMKLVPETGLNPIAEEDIEAHEPVRTPMVRKAITGETIDDFRNALLKPKKRNR